MRRLQGVLQGKVRELEVLEGLVGTYQTQLAGMASSMAATEADGEELAAAAGQQVCAVCNFVAPTQRCQAVAVVLDADTASWVMTCVLFQVVEEVYENQRMYRLIGWSPKLLGTDR